MNGKYMVAAAAALVALTLPIMPADAQQHRGGGSRGGGARVASHAGAPQERAVPRSAQPRAHASQPRTSGQQPRYDGQRAVPPQGPAPRTYDRSYANNGGYAVRAPYYGYGSGYGYRGDPRHGAYVAPRGGSGYRCGYNRRAYYYSRPYYAFPLRVSLGFGLRIAFPIFSSFCSCGYLDPTHGYPLSTFGLEPGVAYGGVSFEIDPSDAAIYADGDYAGIVGDFGPNAQR